MGLSVLLAATACGATLPAQPSPADAAPPRDPGTPEGAEAVAAFRRALAEMAHHDATDDWSPASCARVAEAFGAAAQLHRGSRPLVEAIYDAGLAHRRCDDHGRARAAFSRALAADPRFHRARMHLALYALADSAGRDVDRAIVELERAKLDSNMSNVEVLVNLATLQMRRRAATADADGADDLERAKKNLQRALAVDERFTPAYDQLAVWHLEAGRGASPADASPRRALVGGVAAPRRAREQSLELARLICSQAIRRDPTHAPVYNTLGLVELELGRGSQALSAFNTARRLDPSHFEAHMNAAAQNLGIRGFVPAEQGYRAALRLRPNDYEAHLGLALALRGQIDAANAPRLVRAALAELETAKRIAPERAEAYYNEAILRQEFNAKQAGAGARRELEHAKHLHRRFVEKAGGAPEFTDAVQRSRERVNEIDQVLAFLP
jgi:tetratricopeptide (TPR) repeat protein